MAKGRMIGDQSHSYSCPSPTHRFEHEYAVRVAHHADHRVSVVLRAIAMGRMEGEGRVAVEVRVVEGSTGRAGLS
jgi:hypothetical protein